MMTGVFTGLPIGFITPWLLGALVVVPLIWLLLRAIPPAPVQRRFPGVALLLGLQDQDTVADRTPLWLLVLRSLVLVALIIGLAGPILNPSAPVENDAPLLVLMDGSWASGDEWQDQIGMIQDVLEQSAQQDRPVALVRLTDPTVPNFIPARVLGTELPGVQPMPWRPTADAIARFRNGLGTTRFDTLWLSDGLQSTGRMDLLQDLEARGDVRVIESAFGVYGLRPGVFEDGVIRVTALRSRIEQPTEITVEVHGLDPSGTPRVLAYVPVRFSASQDQATTDVSLPAELRGRISRFEITGQNSAAAVALSDDSLRHREVALISGREDREGLELLSQFHYLRQALIPNADLLEGTIKGVLPANPDVVILADIERMTASEQADLLVWIEQGGLLLRFAGPKTAASAVSRTNEDPLMPVRLRSGGRSIGGAMSWGDSKSLAPFAKDSPFFGLTIPDEVRVTTQVLAQPDPTLAKRSIAELSDGTPLVTRKLLGQGQIVLFHVTANAQWSGLPLSGLFVQMLDRLASLSVAGIDDGTRLAGLTWDPVQVLDGFGRLQDGQQLPGVEGDVLAADPLGPVLWPGLYRHDETLVARNVLGSDDILVPAKWPDRIRIEDVTRAPVRDLSGLFLALALVLMAVDVLASLAVSGRLWGTRVMPALLVLLMLPQTSDAQEANAIRDTREVALAHVMTGNAQIDRLAQSGLYGLSETLYFRTSVEPIAPAQVDLERDEIAFYPLLYWPITPDQPIPSDAAYSKLNTYLRSGGMILFDTRDADVARFGTSSPNGRALQRLALSLDIPPLERLPPDHVLTRTFYLLQDYPGRYDSHDVWVEAAPVDAQKVEGMPFRNLNDGVTPVVIGGNDWAAAWAMDGRGNAMLPVGRGRAGERQRELAYRFGVNLVMHVLTGNYKSDQVHVPALLDRLGQ